MLYAENVFRFDLHTPGNDITMSLVEFLSPVTAEDPWVPGPGSSGPRVPGSTVYSVPEMVVVDTIWQLHTLIGMNSWRSAHLLDSAARAFQALLASDLHGVPKVNQSVQQKS